MSTNFIEFLKLTIAFHLVGSFVSLCIMLYRYFNPREHEAWKPKLHQVLLIALILGWIFTLHVIDYNLIEWRNNHGDID